MKKLSKRNVLFLSFSFSVLISAAVAIPLGIRAYSRTFDAGLLTHNEKLDGAISLSNQENFDRNEFLKLAKTVKIKDNFAKKLSAYDALELHFDKFYSFDLNDIVDFGPILAKFPNFKLKLIVPPKKDQVKVEKNSLKNLAINAISLQKAINFNTQVELQFNHNVEKLEISPENLSLVFQFSNNKVTKNKSVVELAIDLQKKFSENFKKENANEIAAFFKTLPDFGGISILDQKKDQVILPTNFEIRPKLQSEKLVFTKVDNARPKLELQLSLVDKNTMKEWDVFLEFTNFPKINDVKQGKIEEIFKKNYNFKADLARILVFSNLMPSQAIFENLPEKLKNHSDFKAKKVSDFNFWYQKNDLNSLLDEVKKIVPKNFNAENVEFEIENKNFDEKELKKFNEKHQIPLILSVSGKFKGESLIPVGIKLNDKSQFNYRFSFLDDLSDSIYSASLENALNPLDESGNINKNALNLEDLKFEVKQNLPTTIFASTFDETISEWKNKPLDLKNIDKKLKPLFDLLNSSVVLEEKQKTLAAKVSVGTTLFAEEQKSQSLGEKTENSKKPGDILKETLDRLAKTPLLKNRSVFLSSEFSDKYNLILDIKDGKVSEKRLKFPIKSVVANNKPFELLQEKTNLHLFLDWKSNVKTTSKIHKGPIETPRNYVDSISALNNSELKFVPGKQNEQSENVSNESSVIFPFKTEANKGIYLTGNGLELENPSLRQPSEGVKNITIFYVFKPSDIFYPPWTNFSLLKSTKNSSSSENSLDLLIRNYFVPGFNLIGVNFRKNTTEQQGILDNQNPNSLIRTTFNGELRIELRPDGRELNLEHIAPKNDIVTNQDFLNNTDATVMVKLKIENKEAKLSFYTTESNTPYDPVWEIKGENIDFSGFSVNNNLKLGILPPKQPDDNSPYRGAIIFKSLAIFDNSKTIDDKQIAKSFIDEYFDLKQKN
ncbi:P110/LppT family adhesin N-terminal domain [Mesomycoplasma dispar]|uniref:P102/LppT family protein n=1 Tax=Mesomycoplasma dispar TaxID=86660 RepID=A0ABN5DRK3_9BACT|nr:P110/LppT family adhesin N-terminal domain [Mesomycoplasma dispar]ATP59711.1 hypothetical protein CSW10_02060 [Mesomycoplasma dispar]